MNVVGSPRVVSVWLEFEHWDATAERDFFNMQVRLDNGDTYALVVWTFAYAATLAIELQDATEPAFSIGPDLLVVSPERATLEAVARCLAQRGELRDGWKVPEADRLP